LDTLRFRPPMQGLWSTSTIFLRRNEKRVVVFLLVLMELFLLAVTAEALRAIIGSKSANVK